MALSSAVGVSKLDDLVAATREAAAAAKASCPEAKVAFLMVAASYPHDQIPAAAAALRDSFGAQVRTAGGTVLGFLHEGARYDASYAGKAVAILALGGGRVAVAHAALPDPSALGAYGASLAAQVREQLGGEPTAGLLFTPGKMMGEGATDHVMVRAIREALPHVPMSGGGMAAAFDLSKRVPTLTFCGDQHEQDGTLVIAFGGAAPAVALANGMYPLQGSARLTKLQGKVWRELDGKPAKEVVEKLLVGDDAKRREMFHRAPLMYCVEAMKTMAIKEPASGNYIPQIPAHFTPDGGVLGIWPCKEGDLVEVVHIDTKACMNAVQQAGQKLLASTKRNEFDLVMSFSCSLRSLTMGGESANEDGLLRDTIKAKTQLGMVARGEIGALGPGDFTYTGWSYSLFGIHA